MRHGGQDWRREQTCASDTCTRQRTTRSRAMPCTPPMEVDHVRRHHTGLLVEGSDLGVQWSHDGGQQEGCCQEHHRLAHRCLRSGMEARGIEERCGALNDQLHGQTSSETFFFCLTNMSMMQKSALESCIVRGTPQQQRSALMMAWPCAMRQCQSTCATSTTGKHRRGLNPLARGVAKFGEKVELQLMAKSPGVKEPGVWRRYGVCLAPTSSLGQGRRRNDRNNTPAGTSAELLRRIWRL